MRSVVLLRSLPIVLIYRLFCCGKDSFVVKVIRRDVQVQIRYNQTFIHTCVEFSTINLAINFE